MDKTQAKKIHTLFKKHKAFIRSYRDTSNFQEPILILMRRNRKAEFYENATSGNYEIDHTDGTKTTILLNTKHLQTFDYGKKSFVGYICHEDYPTPLPTEPLVTAETVNIAIKKTLNDISKWTAQEIREKGNLYWKVLIGIAIIILAYMVYKMVIVPDAPNPTTIQTATGLLQTPIGNINNT